MDALLAGLLVSHPEWGIAVRVGPGEPQLTFWPHGYTGRIAGDRVELIDNDGQVVAPAGDNIEAGGGLITFGGDKGFGVCPGSITVEPAPPRGAI